MFHPLDWVLRYTIHRTLIAFREGEFLLYVPVRKNWDAHFNNNHNNKFTLIGIY